VGGYRYMEYPLDYDMPAYTTNTEYRECLRRLFSMDPANYPENTRIYAEEWDTETLDEMCYDNETASKIMDFVYEKTKDNELFKKLYDLAAARMISMDREVGLCILFSYDFMDLFHRCVVDFLRTPAAWTSTTESYVALLKKLE